MSTDLLIVPNEGAFRLIKPLIGFKAEIERQLERHPYRENVFLMMKFRQRNRELSDFIIETLDSHDLLGVRADDSRWNLTSNLYNPLAVLYCCKYGIALFDEPEETQAYSANVAYELGMMHYQRKRCLILKHASLPSVPFDLIKDLHLQYDKDLAVRSIVEEWVSQIASMPSHHVDPIPDVSPSPQADETDIEVSDEELSAAEFSYTILKRTSTFWKFAWKVRIRNISDLPLKVRVRASYFDEAGFLIDHDTEYSSKPLAPGEERSIAGNHNVGTDLAVRIQNARVLVTKW